MKDVSFYNAESRLNSDEPEYAPGSCSVFFRDYPGPYTGRCVLPDCSLDENIYASNGACVACGVVNAEGLEAVLNAAWELHTQNAPLHLQGGATAEPCKRESDCSQGGCNA